MQNPAYFVGIDLHKELIQVCVLDAHGEKVMEQRFAGGTLAQGLAVVKVLAKWKKGGRYAVEAVGMNRWLVNAMREQRMDVVVGGPCQRPPTRSVHTNFGSRTLAGLRPSPTSDASTADPVPSPTSKHGPLGR